jgi:hypothetical protein
MGDVVAEFHVLDALRGQQRRGAGRPSDLASAAEYRQPGGDFEATLKSYGALDVCAVLGTERRLDVAADLFQRNRERFNVSVAQVRVLSYFCDSDAASHPNWAVGDASCGEAGRGRLNVDEKGPGVEPRKDSLRPKATATLFTPNAQCSHNHTSPPNRDVLGNK